MRYESHSDNDNVIHHSTITFVNVAFILYFINTIIVARLNGRLIRVWHMFGPAVITRRHADRNNKPPLLQTIPHQGILETVVTFLPSCSTSTRSAAADASPPLIRNAERMRVHVSNIANRHGVSGVCAHKPRSHRHSSIQCDDTPILPLA